MDACYFCGCGAVRDSFGAAVASYRIGHWHASHFARGEKWRLGASRKLLPRNRAGVSIVRDHQLSEYS